MRNVNEIIVHCSATPEGRHVTVDTIRSWHKSRGWSDIGYHYVIYLDGSVHEGRDISRIGAHVGGRNTNTIGICYIGGVAKDARTPKDTRTPAQEVAIEGLISSLKAKYPTITEVSGHNQYAAKACPSFDSSIVYDDLVGRTVKTTKAPARSDPRYAYLQRLLAATGVTDNFGLADGIEGEKTIRAIEQYQEFMGLPITGQFDKATVELLRAVEEKEEPEELKVLEVPVAPVKTRKKTTLTEIIVGILKSLFGSKK